MVFCTHACTCAVQACVNDATLFQHKPGLQQDFSQQLLVTIYLLQIKDGLDLLIRHSNTYGEKWYSAKWTTIDRPEILRFLAIVNHMDNARRSNFKEYWKRGVDGDAFVRSLMSRDRFLAIYTAIRLYDPKEFERGGRPKTPLYKAQDYLDLLMLGFQKVRLPSHRYLSLDEEMTKFMVHLLIICCYGRPSIDDA